MFTGIVSDIGEVLEVVPRAHGLRQLTIGCAYTQASIALGASIACAGACLTVVAIGAHGSRTTFSVDIAAETLAVTTAGRWRKGTRLNLERSLKLGDELGGHLVSGHIDGLAEIVAREELPDMVGFKLRAPQALARFIAPKGSVALDGTSLTINAVEGNVFSVLIIPHTLQATTLGRNRVADVFNLEVDLVARYVARLVESKVESKVESN
jgi:riboflavin synthase